MENKLYLNITNRCSNCCFFCLKNFRRGVGDFNLKLKEEPTFERVTGELETVLGMRNWIEAVFCGFGEPTEQLDILLAVTRWIRHGYTKALVIRVNTNGHGYILNSGRDVARELKSAMVDKVSVSLNASDAQNYEEICRPSLKGSYEAVIDFIKRAKPFLEVEATAVRMPEVDLTKTQAVADGLGVKFRVREYIPCFY